MKDVFRVVLILFAFVLVGTVLAFWSNGLGLAIKEIFGVRSADADRRIFEQSQSYNDGMVRDLENIKMQYETATDAQKAALKATAIHRFSVYPEEKLPPHLRNFYRDLRGGL